RSTPTPRSTLIPYTTLFRSALFVRGRTGAPAGWTFPVRRRPPTARIRRVGGGAGRRAAGHGVRAGDQCRGRARNGTDPPGVGGRDRTGRTGIPAPSGA